MSKSELSHQELAREFLGEAHTEQEVTNLIHDLDGHPNIEWVPLGREPNNYSIVENQQADAMAAFTELVINSIDAVILRSFFEKFGDEYTGSEYTAAFERVESRV